MTTIQDHIANGLGFVAVLAALVLFAAVLGALVDLILKQDLREKMGLTAMPPSLFAVAAALYVLIAFTLVVGLFLLILATIGVPITERGSSPKELADAFLFFVLRIAGLTTVLGAVIALPFTLIRLKLTQEQNDTATKSLFNEKINSAANDLHAQRQITHWKHKNGYVNVWEDDIIKRSTAIDRLEGLAQEYGNRHGAAARVAKLLRVYVYELSKQYPAKEPPKPDHLDSKIDWALKLTAARPDVEKAVQTYARIAHLHGYRIDLSHTNLQAFDFRGLSLRGARLRRAHVDGANFSQSDLVGADFVGASLHGANFLDAHLQDISFSAHSIETAYFSDGALDQAELLLGHVEEAFTVDARMDTKTGEITVSSKQVGKPLTSFKKNFRDRLRERWGEL